MIGVDKTVADWSTGVDVRTRSRTFWIFWHVNACALKLKINQTGLGHGQSSKERR